MTNNVPPPVSRSRLPFRRVLRWLVLAIAITAMAGAALWWMAANWQPDAERWPLRGVAVGEQNAPINWANLAATGAQFAYLDAVYGTRVDRHFTREEARARSAGLRVGAIHHYDLCRMASEQAAAFVTLVPRTQTSLPAAVLVENRPDCRRRPSRALLLSELTTFLNQVETHLGKPMLVSSTRQLDEEYGLSTSINRPLWVRRDWQEPDPTVSPDWVIWQANSHLRSEGASGTVRRLVLNGAGL